MAIRCNGVPKHCQWRPSQNKNTESLECPLRSNQKRMRTMRDPISISHMNPLHSLALSNTSFGIIRKTSMEFLPPARMQAGRRRKGYCKPSPTQGKWVREIFTRVCRQYPIAIARASCSVVQRIACSTVFACLLQASQPNIRGALCTFA